MEGRKNTIQQGGPKTGWTGSGLSRAVGDRTPWTSLIHGVARSQSPCWHDTGSLLPGTAPDMLHTSRF